MDARTLQSCPFPLVKPGEKGLFTPVRDWLAERTELSWPAKFLYARLERYADRKIDARPSREQLARDMGVPLGTLKRYLAELHTKFDGMPLVWSFQTGNGPARYVFTAHPWRAEQVIHTVVHKRKSGGSNMGHRTQPGGSNPGHRTGAAINDRPRAVVGDNRKTETTRSAGGGASRRGPVFTDRGHVKGQQRVARLLAGIGGNQ